MNLLGISFILHFLKLSYGSRFWKNLPNDNIELYKTATLSECLAKKLRKHELDLKFLVTCRDTGVFPKFTRWRNVNKNNAKFKNKFYRKILLDEISKKQKSIKVMK